LVFSGGISLCLKKSDEEELIIVETLTLVVIVLIVSALAGIYKVEETMIKARHREVYGKSYAFLSNKGYMQLIFFILMLPLIIGIDWSVDLFLLLGGLSLLRFVPWVLVAVAKGRYQDTEHQMSSNFIMLENFAGPLGALIVYGVLHALGEEEAPLWLYMITPMAGVFLLWALREKEEPLSSSMLKIILLQSLLVSAETVVIVYLQYKSPEVVNIPQWLGSFPFMNKPIFLFMVTIALSSLWIACYFGREIIRDMRRGLGGDALKIGLISGVHEVLYFASFVYFGPIFLIARRGLLIPVQNLYLGLKKGKVFGEMLLLPLREPLLSLRGGKDFIISFIDLLFNAVVKYAIAIFKG